MVNNASEAVCMCICEYVCECERVCKFTCVKVSSAAYEQDQTAFW